MRRLRTELAAVLLLVALAPLAAALGVSWWLIQSTLEAEVGKSLRAIAGRQAASISDAVAELEAQTERLAESAVVARAMMALVDEPRAPETMRAAEELADLLAVSAPGEGGNLYLVARDGRLLHSAAPGPPIGARLGVDTPESELSRVVARAAAVLETSLGDISLDPATGAPVLLAATPVFSGGRLLGVLVQQAPAGRILRGVENLTGLGATGETVVAMESEGRALVVAPLRSDPGAALKLVVDPRSRPDAAILKAVRGGRGAGLAMDHAGEQVFAVWRYLPSVRWGVVVKVDEAEAFASVARLGRLVALLLGGTIVLVPVVAFQQAHRLTRPLLRLRHMTRRVADGAFDVDVRVDSRNEISELADSFGEMTRRLKHTFEELRRTTAEREEAARVAQEARAEVERVNLGLEQTVADRTAELRARNDQLQEALDHLRRTQDQLVVREKMASLGELTAGIAHEISNPLNFVNNFADLSREAAQELREALAAEASALPPSAREAAEDILPTLDGNLGRVLEHGRRAQRIVEGMIEMTRGATGERRPVDLSPFVQEFCRAALQASRSRGQAAEVHVELELAEALPPVTVHAAELSRALVNVFGNALWAAGEKARATPGHEPRVHVRTFLAGEAVAIAIRDNGPGIPPAHLDRIFQPFFTTRPTGSGATGLGLAVAWEVVVTLHGGRIEVESEPGSHAEFILHIPLADGAPR